MRAQAGPPGTKDGKIGSDTGRLVNAAGAELAVPFQVQPSFDLLISGLGSFVARKKTSSRLASPACTENLWVISSIVPSMILRPCLRMSTWEQISSTR